MVLGILRKLLRKRLVRWPECLKPRRRRWWRRRLKGEFVFFQSLSRLFQLAYFVKCWQTFLKLNSCGDPPLQRNVQKSGMKKCDACTKFCLCWPALFTPLGEILSLLPFPVNWIVYFSGGSISSDNEGGRGPSTLRAVLFQGKNYCSQGNDRGARNRKINLQKLPRVAEKG